MNVDLGRHDRHQYLVSRLGQFRHVAGIYRCRRVDDDVGALLRNAHLERARGAMVALKGGNQVNRTLRGLPASHPTRA